MRILGLLSSHDCSFCVLEDGVPTIHAELERYIREKEPEGDPISFFEDVCKGDIKFDQVAVIQGFVEHMSEKFPDGLRRLSEMLSSNDAKLNVFGHHQSHAANAFYSSNFDEALIVTLDGGGLDKDMDGKVMPTSFSVWEGYGAKINKIAAFHSTIMNIGFAWQRVTKLVFNLSSGHPVGNQAGTVMAMACMGDPSKHLDYFEKFNFRTSCYSEDTPCNDGVFDFPKMRKIASKSEQDSFDVAAALQKATENKVKDIFDALIVDLDTKNLCLSGGVFLNSVLTGKLYDWYGHIFDNIYVCPVAYDSGLAIGAAQYLWHHVLDNPKVKWSDNCTPYLGEAYQCELESILQNKNLEYKRVTDDEVLDLLDKQNIVSVFKGPSESGRRALGGRSILADPRSGEMKALINDKVKHRQWFRPFAPSILREEVHKWFEKDIDSPYMSFVIKFKKDMRDKVPAVVHYDGTARLQTVTENDNEWYYNFLLKWKEKSGVPILLNTSFNDREPIVENYEHAINCYLGTDIDYLYFVDDGILVNKF